MIIEQRLIAPTSRANAWDVLMDVPRVGRCFPGVERVTSVGDGSFEGNMKVRVGPVSLNFSGTIQVVKKDTVKWSASFRVDGADRRIGGAVKGTVDMELVELSPEETEVMITSDVSLMGKLGELGQPLIKKKTNSVIQEFARNLVQEVSRP
jgi:carbon monoxide dehydrogenase subunit G